MTRLYRVTCRGHAPPLEVVADPLVHPVVAPEIQACPEIGQVLILTGPAFARCDLDDPLIVDVSAALARQMRDDALQWRCIVVTELKLPLRLHVPGGAWPQGREGPATGYKCGVFLAGAAA